MSETGKTPPDTPPLEKPVSVDQTRLNDIIGADDYEFGAEEAPGSSTLNQPDKSGPGRSGPQRR